jgi:hypothetical protein
LYWDGSLSSFTIKGPDSSFLSEYYLGAKTGFSGGDTVDFSTAIPATNAGNHPLLETFNGQQYQAWISGQLTIRARTFVAPPANGDGGTSQTFTTPFTLSGSISAYATADRSGAPLFSSSLTGGGTITATYRVVGNQYVMNSGGEVLTFVEGGNLPAPWKAADIGAVGAPGYAYQGPDADLFFGAAGSDIWGASDSFGFVYAPIAGDAAVTADLCCESDTSPLAKFGVMLRQSVDPGAPSVILDVMPDGGVEFMMRTTPGGDTAFLAGGRVPAQTLSPGLVDIGAYASLTRAGSAVTATICSLRPGSTCQTIGTAEWISGPALAGVAATSHDPAQLNRVSVPANMPTLTTPAGNAVSPPWHYTDVGPVGIAGSASVPDGLLVISAAGADIWDFADSFGAVTQPLAGDGIVTAQLLGESATDSFAKAGVTIGALSPSSARVVLDVKPDGGVEFMARVADGASMSFLAGGTLRSGGWVKLTRSAHHVTATISSDGRTWTAIGSVDISFGGDIEAGLVVTSHDTKVLNTARFAAPSATAASIVGQNLLTNPGFESSAAPSIGPGWVSDSYRQTDAHAETANAQTGSNDGACRTTRALDCGLYQDVVIPADGSYALSAFTAAGQAGAWIGWNLNGAPLASTPVSAGGYQPQTFSHDFSAGDTVRVWLYLPAAPGWATIDTASLVMTAAR